MTTKVNHPVLERLRAEYLEMPGLSLKAAQVERLCGVDRALCKIVLDRLVDEGFLWVKADGSYARLTDSDIPRALPVRGAA